MRSEGSAPSALEDDEPVSRVRTEIGAINEGFGRLAPAQGSAEAARRALRSCREAVTVEQVLARVPGAVTDALALSRAVVWVGADGAWTPEAWSENAEAAALGPCTLAPHTPEAEMARRGAPIHSATPCRLMHDTINWIGTPIVSERRPIALIVADRCLGGMVDAEDRDRLGAFGEAIAAIIERTILLDRARANTRAARALAAQLEASFDDETQPMTISLRGAPPPVPVLADAAANPIQDHRLLGLLTRRELEVLELMASGARNAQIGAALVVSNGTVKSHVKNILRKLHATNRTEAISRYLRIVSVSADTSRRTL